MTRKLHHQRLDSIRNMTTEELLAVFCEERVASSIVKKLNLFTEDLYEARKIFSEKEVLEDFERRCRKGSSYLDPPRLLISICKVCGSSSSETYFARGRNTCRKCERIIWENNKKDLGLNGSELRRQNRRNYRSKRARATNNVNSVRSYEEMFAEQEGRCKICRRKEWRSIQGHLLKLCVDHCHETGLVRGLLCYQCNAGLGMFHDDVERLKRAILYLQNSLAD